MKTVCKLKLTECKQHYYNPGARTLVFNAVYDTSIPEDLRFYEATPTGHFEMYVNNPAVIENMKLGDSFYVTFEKAEQDE